MSLQTTGDKQADELLSEIGIIFLIQNILCLINSKGLLCVNRQVNDETDHEMDACMCVEKYAI